MDKEILGGLIIHSEDTMYHIAKTLLREDADCEDAISAAIVKAFSKIHTLREDSLAKTWLVRILINECYTLLRQKKNLISLEEYPQQEKPGETQDYSELYEALQQLPEESRICISLFYMEGYSIKEIAGLLKLSESGVKSRLARARIQVRRDMERMDQMEPVKRLAMKKV